MRILLVNDYGTPTGGAELLWLGLRAQLQALGHEVRLLTSRAEPGGARSLADEHCAGTTGRWRTVLQSANPAACMTLRRLLSSFQPDVVHVGIFLTQLSPLILPLLRLIPAVHTAMWYRTICPKGTRLLPDAGECRAEAGQACLQSGCLPYRDWLPLMFQMRLWRRNQGVFDRVVPISEAVRTRLVEGGIACTNPILPGVPETPSRPPLSSPPTAAFAGRLVPEKGVLPLLQAFTLARRRIPEARLAILGDGPERPQLEREAVRLGVADAVRFGGHLDRKPMERALASAWVQVVPSLWAEPFGLVAAEAAMRGTAVIATRSGGLEEIVRDGTTGTLVPPGDVAALAESLVFFLTRREMAERMGAAARQEAQHRFSEVGMARAYEALYREVLAERGAQPVQPDGSRSEWKEGIHA